MWIAGLQIVICMPPNGNISGRGNQGEKPLFSYILKFTRQPGGQSNIDATLAYRFNEYNRRSYNSQTQRFDTPV